MDSVEHFSPVQSRKENINVLYMYIGLIIMSATPLNGQTDKSDQLGLIFSLTLIGLSTVC